jgi:thiamine pyrophosphate-dependent acetolactate synthase large subunit-like protein
MTVMTLGARVADLLLAEGIDKFFSLPEVTFGTLHDALDKQGVKLVAPHHEAAAGFMAEAYAQLTGQIGVVGGSVGPGTMNLYPAIANSWEEHLPILYLGSERTLMARNSPRQSRFQAPPNIDVVRPITKYAAIVEDAHQCDDIFHEAFRQLRSGTPGPVYIGLPFDMLLEEHEFDPVLPPQKYRPATFVDTVSDGDIESAIALLRGARRPVIIGGSGIRMARSQGSFAAFVEAAGCPVVLTIGGRGVLPLDHRQLFDLGAGPGAEVTGEADVVLAIGTSISEKLGFGGKPFSRTQRGFPNHFHPDATWIHLERDPMTIGRNRPVDLALVGDLALALPRMARAMAAGGPLPGTENVSRLRAERTRYQQSLYGAAAVDTSPVHPGRMLTEVQKTLPEDVIMVRDGGAISVWQMHYLNHGLSENLMALKQGMLGTGLPYANAAALVAKRDGRRVCLITGDGSFGFHAMELETAVRHELPVVIVVAYDAGWSLEVPYYMHVVGRTFEVDHRFVRLDELARTMGAHGEFCERAEEIGPAMRRAFDSGKPALVQVVIDRQVNAFDMPHPEIWTRWHGDKSVYIT